MGIGIRYDNSEHLIARPGIPSSEDVKSFIFILTDLAFLD